MVIQHIYMVGPKEYSTFLLSASLNIYTGCGSSPPGIIGVFTVRYIFLLYIVVYTLLNA